MIFFVYIVLNFKVKRHSEKEKVRIKYFVKLELL